MVTPGTEYHEQATWDISGMDMCWEEDDGGLPMLDTIYWAGWADCE
jgi:hypothetical protein